MTNSYSLKCVAIPTRNVNLVFPVLSYVVFLLYISGVPFYLHVRRVSGCLFTYFSGVFLASISRLCLHCLDFPLLDVNSKHHLFKNAIFFKSLLVPCPQPFLPAKLSKHSHDNFCVYSFARNFGASVSCNISWDFFQV